MCDVGGFEARAHGLVDGGCMQMLGATIKHDGVVTSLVFDYVGRLAAVSSSDLEMGAETLARLAAASSLSRHRSCWLRSCPDD